MEAGHMEHDYVIVGSGSAGSALAARLVEKGASVLLLEAGKRERLHVTRLPGAVTHVIGNKRYDWDIATEPDPTRNDGIEKWPRGRVPGGSSAINGMIYIRGDAKDYDEWEALGNPGWGWRDVLPYFRKLETADAGTDNLVRGGMGPQRVSTVQWRHPVSQKFISTFANLGVAENPDLNGVSHEGVGWNQGSIKNGIRHSAFDAYVLPKLSNPKLTFWDEALVERVDFDGKRATGVVVRRGGAVVHVAATIGVILSAGAINTPQILLLSGIGDTAELAKHAIRTVVESPEVGRNLMEHTGLWVTVELDIPTANQYGSRLGKLKALASWVFGRTGLLSVPTAQVLAFIRSTTAQAVPDLQFHLFPFGWTVKNGKIHFPPRNQITILVNLNHPKSRSHVALKSSDPRVPIAIYPRLLDDPADVDTIRRGLDWVRKLVSTPPLGSHVLNVCDIPPADAGREADEAYIRRAAGPFQHPVGTCRMGSDETAVVTPDLKVRGAEGLWVADASIFPRLTAGNTNSTAIMIGERASDLIHP
jgi:choline dehydrogenase